ncbi:hypothetical protein [Amycolatopsis sp. CFH S0078]|uniref:hypothetical protein n=1 Tax=Amycolatopsis sp. CFH S0078 TaxID=1644108 RepID=UPI00106E903F|nr:hypothetical protein [Amycolatopsis sp. CFH S0078]
MFKTGQVTGNATSGVLLFSTSSAVPTTVTVSAAPSVTAIAVAGDATTQPGIPVPNPTTFESFVGSVYVVGSGSFNYIAHNAE